MFEVATRSKRQRFVTFEVVLARELLCEGRRGLRFFFDAVMPQHCCVPECSSNSRKNSDDGQRVGFHSFPSDPDLLKRWIVNIRRDVSEHFSLNAHTKVCSLHFEEESFYPGENRRDSTKKSSDQVRRFQVHERCTEGLDAPMS